MKIAIVHDYLKEFGGAEKVVEALLEIWPKAPVFTSVFLPQYAGPHREKVEKWNIKTTFLQYIPLKSKFISLFRF
ncbi:glycosyltransferase family 4 protein, partial [Candidatus Woesebacteria bacterium]|nr:glycosyltransferase family 4 protein [Candidatus Woesebacteria bacterium]